jgi:hypothetical protein
MKINRASALRLWDERYGDQRFATDFHGILPCTNIATNEVAEDKITFWIEGCLYQVKRVPGSSEHEIVRID